MTKSPLTVYEHMYNASYFPKLARFYTAYAGQLEAQSYDQRAQEIIKIGIQRRAQPADILQFYSEFAFSSN